MKNPTLSGFNPHNFDKPTFDKLWREITERSSVMTVQEYHELKYIYDLIAGSSSYLEIGTAEGNSFYVLSQSLKATARTAYVDYGEKHTTPARNELLKKLVLLGRNRPLEILGDSNDPNTVKKLNGEKFDVVLIDAGHTYHNVITDAAFYGKLAKKYVIFHDVQLPEVKEAFEEYTDMRDDCKSWTYINSETFGYGILEVLSE